jgi:hypothetical protein
MEYAKASKLLVLARSSSVRRASFLVEHAGVSFPVLTLRNVAYCGGEQRGFFPLREAVQAKRYREHSGHGLKGKHVALRHG